MERTFAGCALVTLLLASASAPATAQIGFGVGLQASTMGAGGLVALGSDQVTLRASGNILPFDIEMEASDVDYDISLPSPQFLATVDWYPGGSGFRLGGGVMISSEDLEIEARLSEAVEIGGRSYLPEQIGSLFGTAENRTVAPYVGLGFGNPTTGGRVGFLLDLGVAFHGEPTVTLTAEEGTLSASPELRDDLAREAAEIEDDLAVARFYPVLSIGLSIRLR